ncbi:hypothetical protein P3T22_002755 [Paraburkholderia sp. GAS348]
MKADTVPIRSGLGDSNSLAPMPPHIAHIQCVDNFAGEVLNRYDGGAVLAVGGPIASVCPRFPQKTVARTGNTPESPSPRA